MAADILAYNADLVPVGADQKQHLELTRNVAIRFNGIYGDTFVVPEPYIPKEAGRIMSLADPTRKMSKSDENPKAYISILDEPSVVVKKIKSAVTDSEGEVAYREGKDGINNLLTIYSACSGITIPEAEKEFAGKGYGEFKLAVAEAVNTRLQPVREEYARLIEDKAYLTQVYQQGAERALAISSRVLAKVYKKVGLVAK